MPIYRIDLGYDGSGFRGYATNPGVRTVQGTMEEALARVLRQDVATIVAGRTDAGVHAIGQVVSFEFEDELDVPSVERSIRSMLSPEIAVHRLSRAADDFHARFSAVSRTYRYRICDLDVADPLTRATVWHYDEPLDVALMSRAAQAFVGDRDFASLCRARPDKTTQRTVYRAEWNRVDDLVVYEVEGKAFCHQLVRSMVALCVDVGRGKVSPEALPGIIEARDRNASNGAAPPHGLILVAVGYKS
jgi:tRNA pseudouridine38-40 synthase